MQQYKRWKPPKLWVEATPSKCVQNCTFCKFEAKFIIHIEESRL